jgi:hypothetical protein
LFGKNGQALLDSGLNQDRTKEMYDEENEKNNIGWNASGGIHGGVRFYKLQQSF